MFLKACTLVDVASISGTHISAMAYYGQASNNIRQFSWPRQPPNLPKTYWAVWRQALCKTFAQPHGNSQDLKLRNCLGAWTDTDALDK